MTIEYIKKYFIIWWVPIAFHLFAIGIFFLGITFRYDWIITLFLFVFLINILGNIISSIIQFARKKWHITLLQLGIAGGLFIFTSLIFTYAPPDYYGAHKEIPIGIEIYDTPEKTTLPINFETHNLVISGWGGNYSYYTNYQPSEKGCFHIKAYEITSNDRLSSYEINNSSKLVVDQLGKELYSGSFTIYEGDWGDKYGSRIELWFQPLMGKNEYKITERNFIVEGWMR